MMDFTQIPFKKPLDIPVAIIQMWIVFLLLICGMEEKSFDKKTV